jgi:hypothetical protein
MVLSPCSGLQEQRYISTSNDYYSGSDSDPLATETAQAEQREIEGDRGCLRVCKYTEYQYTLVLLDHRVYQAVCTRVGSH